MGSKKQLIDTDIYSISDNISKKYKKQLWAIICIIFGAACIYYYVFVVKFNVSLLMMQFLLGGAFLGIFSFLTLIFYYILGDSYAPYYKPKNEFMEREEMFFDKENESKITNELNFGNFMILDEVAKGIFPQVIVVKYSDSSNNIVAAQIFKNVNGDKIPVSNILFRENEE